MVLRVSMCQMRSVDDPVENLARAETCIGGADSDLFVFPEMFLSSYGGTLPAGFAERAIGELRRICIEKDCAVCMGLPMEDGGLRNSLAFITPDDTVRYDKRFLARFGDYAETGFEAGTGQVMAEWKGMMFGLSICYDVMFPETHRGYAMGGADAVIVASASLSGSRRFMETVCPARSLENTVYTVYVNNTGRFGDGTFFGRSTLYSPLGETVTRLGQGEEIVEVVLDRDEIERARRLRPHLADLKSSEMGDIYHS